MSVGNKPAFPSGLQSPQIGVNSGAIFVTPPEQGMTYRQWLIGMIAMGCAAQYGTRFRSSNIVSKADAIITLLDDADVKG